LCHVLYLIINPMDVNMVQQAGKNLHLLREELARWRIILEIPYREYLLNH